MRRSLLLGALCAALSIATAVAVPPAANAAACSGRCETVSVPLPAGVHVTSNKVEVLLPAGYSTSSTRFPVVYLLCGAKGNDKEWTTYSDVESFTATLKAIFVMPDCGGASGVPGWYSDWVNGKYDWETYYIKVVMPWVDSHLRTIKHDDAIAGLSMGGYGALALAARHPSLFKAVGSFSGLADTQYGQPVSNGVVSSDIWGDPTTDKANWTAHNPTAIASKLAGKQLYIATGTGGTDAKAPGDFDTFAKAELSAYHLVEENYIFQTNLPLLKALNDDGIPYHSDIYPGGAHSWYYFEQDAHWALPQIVADLH